MPFGRRLLVGQTPTVDLLVCCWRSSSHAQSEELELIELGLVR